MADRDPEVMEVLQYFQYDHLPERLQPVSKPFWELAYVIAGGPHNTQTKIALYRLLDSKDAAVRAHLSKTG